MVGGLSLSRRFVSARWKPQVTLIFANPKFAPLRDPSWIKILVPGSAFQVPGCRLRILHSCSFVVKDPGSGLIENPARSRTRPAILIVFMSTATVSRKRPGAAACAPPGPTCCRGSCSRSCSGAGVRYYWHPPTQRILARLSVLRVDLGLVSALSPRAFAVACCRFSICATVRARRRLGWRRARFSPPLGLQRLEIDLFYRLLAWTVGVNHDVRTVICKAFSTSSFIVRIRRAADVLAYEWSEGVSPRPRSRRHAGSGLVWRRVLPCSSPARRLVAGVAIIYTLPTPLQLRCKTWCSAFTRS